jgi:hypothetical protein
LLREQSSSTSKHSELLAWELSLWGCLRFGYVWQQARQSKPDNQGKDKFAPWRRPLAALLRTEHFSWPPSGRTCAYLSRCFRKTLFRYKSPPTLSHLFTPFLGQAQLITCLFVTAQARCQALTGCRFLEGLGEHKQVPLRFPLYGKVLLSDTRPSGDHRRQCPAPE